MMQVGMRKRVAVLLGGIGVVGGLALAPPAGAVEDVEVMRLAGTDRFQTAVAVADAAHPTGTDQVIVANGRSFPDALAGAALAGSIDAPVLLTERAQLPSATATAVDDLQADTVHILGGTATVSPEVAAELAEGGRTVVRIAGDDRYETAAEIARTVGADNIASLGGRRTAIVATGLDFADALAGGPIAGAGDGSGVHPILLVNSDVPAATEAAIRDLRIQQVVILGGSAAVSATVEAELETLTGSDAVRLAGADRYATGAAVARAALDQFGFGSQEVLLANGVAFADALAGGPLGAERLAPIVLTQATSLPAPTRSFLEAENDTIETITVLGGTAVVSSQVAQAAEQAAEVEAARPANEAITVSPSTDEEQANGTSREYTVTDLDTTTVDIVLVECADVTTASGETRLPNADGNAVADGTARSGTAPDLAAVPNARLSSVNGTTRQSGDPSIPNDDYATDVSPVNGSVTFVVQGPTGTATSPSTATVCVVPIVFVDVNVDNALNGTTANPTAPTEAFGTGGRVTFSPSGAGAGQFGAHEVQSTLKASDRFNACRISTTTGQPTSECPTFRYDANDSFQVNSAPISSAEFEARLSIGDEVRGTYDPEPSGVSTFNLTDAEPQPPTGVTASASGTIVRVSFTDSPTPTVDLYRLYRATRTTATCPDFGPSTYSPVQAQASTVEGQPDQGETADTGNASPPLTPAPTYTIADRTPEPTTSNPTPTYCYVVVSVDKESASDATGDESAGTAPVTATTGKDQVIVTDSRATSADDTLNAADKLVFTFDEPVTFDADATLGGNTAITVRGSNMVGAADETLTCGPAGTTKATCTYENGVLTVTVAEGVTTAQEYPLTLQAITVTAVDNGEPVDLGNSDRRIQQI